MHRQLYASLEGEDFSPFPIEPSDAARLNNQRYGIFWSVNEFAGERQIAKLKHINSWFVEIDEAGGKPLALARIQSSPILPSQVIETKAGYHVYFFARDATQSGYREIQTALCEFFKADPRARDLARVLRAPGFQHWKDPTDPYLVKEIFRSDVNYPERAMRYYFVAPRQKKISSHVLKKTPTPGSKRILSASELVIGDEKFPEETEVALSEKLKTLDHEWALKTLSGKPCVRSEVYGFRPVANGKLNILVNGKSTSCFIDERKMIGASPGGPTVWQWLKYYGNSNQEIARILKEELNL